MDKLASSRADDYWVATEAALRKVSRKRADAGAEGERKLAAISAAKNEYESFQVIVCPSDGKRLEGVEVEVSDILHAETGFVIPKEEIETNLVGYVETKHVEHTRWWPDPLLPLEPFDVA